MPPGPLSPGPISPELELSLEILQNSNFIASISSSISGVPYMEDNVKYVEERRG